MDQITLEDVAQEAEVTVQTVIRRFGSRAGLLQAAAQLLGREVEMRRSRAAAGDWRAHVRAVVDDYEVTGDLIVRLLAQEERWPALQPVLAAGRTSHRDQTALRFGPWLAELKPAERKRRLAALVAVTDVYTWKLLRRDHSLGVPATTDVMLDLVGRLIGEA